ncbi:Serine/threonine-protein kinase CHK1 [Termitomyces sp. J132]|nr:Serine/threonine-protein kinase CHK1 [Termitomyces sp. J132]
MHLVTACKLITFTPTTTPTTCKFTEKEIRIHSILKHPHILKFLNAIVVKTKHAHLYMLGIYMLMELAGGSDLFDKIIPDVGITDDVAHLYFNQLLSGMDYIHSQGMCHHNFKPKNLLLNATSNLKISDFGLLAVYKLKESGCMHALIEHCGRLPYVAPKMHLNLDKPYSTKPIDVWSIGIILYAMLTGTLICGLLTIDLQDRLTLTDAFQHPWCIHPSQLASQMPSVLTEQLTVPLHANGNMMLAAPDLHMSSCKDHNANANEDREGNVDTNKDKPMPSTQLLQFTQSLMLFMCLLLYLLTSN